MFSPWPGTWAPRAAARFTGAIGWVLAQAPGVILDLTALRGWSAGGQMAVTQSARLHPRAFGLRAALAVHRAVVSSASGAGTRGPASPPRRYEA
ncbi:hypothetical protein [Streptomyces europaeiscabiei]|uniref:hypothetical protein n=1 Tax=Streptomyces europaeiscabiei TaxID=146819 RepID=UPI0029BD89B0|nr:hypothetical protein [Streptomyces europaeiscabiei]MDX2530985.1 hypothetical protein [Streptomyces europaeiscabiei]